jgi:hypothetical protein
VTLARRWLIEESLSGRLLAIKNGLKRYDLSGFRQPIGIDRDPIAVTYRSNDRFGLKLTRRRLFAVAVVVIFIDCGSA